MMSRYQFLCCSVVLSVLISAAAGISCAVCSGDASEDDGCYAGNIKDSDKVDCPSNSNTYKCLTRLSTYSENSTRNYVRRGCTSDPLKDGCEDVGSYLGYTQRICICSDKDNCNSSTQLTGSAVSLLFIAFCIHKIAALL